MLILSLSSKQALLRFTPRSTADLSFKATLRSKRAVFSVCARLSYQTCLSKRNCHAKRTPHVRQTLLRSKLVHSTFAPRKPKLPSKCESTNKLGHYKKLA